MIKNIKILVLLIIMTSLTGCVQFKETLEIGKFKKANLEIIYAIDKNVTTTPVFTEDEINVLKENNYKVEEYKKDNYEGYKITYRISNIDNVSTTKDTTYSLNSVKENKVENMFKVKKSLFKNHYTAKLIFDATPYGMYTMDNNKDEYEYQCDDGSIVTYSKDSTDLRPECHRISEIELNNIKSGENLTEEELTKKYSKDIDLKFVLKGSNIKKTNATTKKNNTYTWDLNSEGVTEINFSFERYNYLIITLFILITISIIVLIIKLLKKDKKSKK